MASKRTRGAVVLSIDLMPEQRDRIKALAADRGVGIGAMILALAERERDARAATEARGGVPVREMSTAASAAVAAAEAGDLQASARMIHEVLSHPLIAVAREIAAIYNIGMRAAASPPSTAADFVAFVRDVAREVGLMEIVMARRAAAATK